VAEGAPLLREYGVLSLIKGSNPFVSASDTQKTYQNQRLKVKVVMNKTLVPALVPSLVGVEIFNYRFSFVLTQSAFSNH